MPAAAAGFPAVLLALSRIPVVALLALHVTSIITLARASRPAQSAAGPLIPGVTPA